MRKVITHFQFVYQHILVLHSNSQS